VAPGGAAPEVCMRQRRQAVPSRKAVQPEPPVVPLEPLDELPRPVCGAVMAVARRHGVALDVCERHGAWLDRGEPERLLA